MNLKKTIQLILLIIVVFSCSDKNTKTHKEEPKLVKKTLLDKDIEIIVEHKATYLNSQSKPYVLLWQEYLDLQKKVYALKKTNTTKLQKQHLEIDSLIDVVVKSKIPEDLNVLSFDEKMIFLEDLNLYALEYLKEEDITIDQIKKNLTAILNAYKSTKNEIRSIYAAKEK